MFRALTIRLFVHGGGLEVPLSHTQFQPELITSICVLIAIKMFQELEMLR